MKLTHDWDDKGFPAGTKPGERFMRTMDPMGRRIVPQEEEALSLEEAIGLNRRVGALQILQRSPDMTEGRAALPKSLPLDVLAEHRRAA